MLRARLAFPFLVLNTLGCPADDPDVDDGTETSGDSTTDDGDDGSDTAHESSGSDGGSEEAGSGDASSGEPCAPIGQPGPCCTGISVDGVCCADFGDACEPGQCCFGECDEATGLCPEAPQDCGLIGESCLEAECCEGLSCSDEGCQLVCAELGEPCIETGCCEGLTCDGESSACIATTACAAEGEWCGGKHQCCEDESLLYCDKLLAECMLQPK